MRALIETPRQDEEGEEKPASMQSESREDSYTLPPVEGGNNLPFADLFKQAEEE